MIHPFIDGNGRIGRLLIPIFLFERGILSRPVFYLSAFFEEHKDEYLNRLNALSSTTDRQAWSTWIEFFLRAITEQSKLNLEAARSIIALYERSKSEIIGITRSQYAVPILDALFEQPVFSPEQLEKHPGMPSKQMIARLLGKLKEKGILVVTREPSGRRPQIVAFADLVNLCEGHEVIPPAH